MGMRIEGGKTSVNTVVVDSDGKMEVRSIGESESQWATESGDAYNINTGTVGLTSSTESGILYLYNDEPGKIMIVEALVVGVGTAGTTTDVTTATVVRNPTSVSFSTDVDMNQNRNFGSSNTLSSTTLAYKGAEAATVTGGDDIIQFYVNPGTRMYAPIDLELTKGNSLAIKADTNTSSGTTNIYMALIIHLKDEDYA